MKTLELKHVAPYLVYGLEFITPNGKKAEMTINGCYTKIKTSFGSNLDKNISFKCLIQNYKPILRPLSQLTQDEKTCDEINLLLEPNGLEINNFLLLKNTYEAVCVSWSEMQEVLNILYREHYDVFGLIEQDLAIEKL